MRAGIEYIQIWALEARDFLTDRASPTLTKLRLVVKRREPRISVVHVEDGDIVHLEGHKAPVLGVSFDPLGKYLVWLACLLVV